MNAMRIFVIDDEDILRISLADDLRDEGFEVVDFNNPLLALNAFKEKPGDVVITDLKMPDMDGVELLKQIKALNPDTEVILMTAYGSVDNAVQAMKLGAYDYISKPFQMDELLVHLRRIQDIKNLQKNNVGFQRYFQEQYPLTAFVGSSPGIQKVLELVKIVAESDSTVLITGETGTGKELLANIIHYNSLRSKQPLIKVSCAILAKEVIESELFGHVKGAFTGATKDKPGRFELAHNGTIYLDDVDDIPLEVQVKLLRVLQEREVERVGATEARKINVRVIASTKYDLKQLAKEGRFREDLFYRLNVFPIHIPPLRERKEDIPVLAEYFLKQLAPQANVKITDEALNCLQAYDWPGNVRELKNVLERMVLLSQGKNIDLKCIPEEMQRKSPLEQMPALGQKPLDQLLAETEISLIREALDKAEGNQKKAAELLQIPPTTLRSKIQKYNLKY